MRSAASVAVSSPSRTCCSSAGRERAVPRGGRAAGRAARRGPSTRSSRPAGHGAWRPARPVESSRVRCCSSRSHTASRPVPRGRCSVSTGGVQAASGRVHQPQRARQFTGRGAGVALVRAVRLVDGDHVGQLQDALLDALELVAGAGQGEQQEGVDHARDGGLGLADADRLHQHHVVARRPPSPRSTRGSPWRPRRACPRVGEGRTNAAGSTASRSIRVLSPRMEPPVRLEDGSTASTATRWPSPVSMRAERVDEGRLARPRAPR